MKVKRLLKKSIFLFGFLIPLFFFGNSIYTPILGDEITDREKRVITEKRITLEQEWTRQTPQYVSGEVLVKFKEGVDPQSVLQKINLEVKNIERVYSIKPAIANFKKDHKLEKDSNGWYWFRGKRYKEVQDISDEDFFREAYAQMSPEEQTLYRSYKITFSEEMSTEKVLANLKKNCNVEYAEPNYIRKVKMIPNDPYYHSTEINLIYGDLWGLKKIECEAAWDISQGEDIVVAVIDTGVDYDHEDLAVNIWENADEIPDNGIDDDNNGYIDDVKGWDFAYADNDPMDEHGHGTHCAGTIAAVGNNGIGVIGVAPMAKIMVVKGLNDNGDGGDADLVECVKYAADNGASILNNSWGGLGSSQILEDAFNYANAIGCVSIAAAGNDKADVKYFSPANIDCVIAVAATDDFDEKTYFSNYGPDIDVAAPGIDILSLRADNTDMYGDGYHIVGEKYYRANGTSMACPHVAGVCALILANNPSLDVESVRKIIRTSADDISREYDNKDKTILSRLNATKALDRNTPIDLIAFIASPISGSTVVPPTPVEVRGVASGSNFGSYTLEYGYTTIIDPTYRWVIAEQSETPVENNVLGSFNLPEHVERLMILISVYDTTRSFQEHDISVINISNSSIKNGWPVRLEYVEFSWITAADLEGSGISQLIIGGGCGFGDSLVVLDPDGTDHPGSWPIQLDQQDDFLQNLIIWDPDIGDPYQEIVPVDLLGNIWSVRHNGTLAPGCPYHLELPNGYQPEDLFPFDFVASDIEGDGNHDLLASCRLEGEYYVYALKREIGSTDLTTFWTAPVSGSGTLIVGDFVTGIQGNECILVSDSTVNFREPVVYVFDSQGNELTRQVFSDSKYFYGAYCVDLDRYDGKVELVLNLERNVSSNEPVYTIEVWSIDSQDGSIALHWSKNLRCETLPGDIELDGKVEIIAMEKSSVPSDRRVYIWGYNGQEISSFSTTGIGNYYMKLLADIDEDGILDVITTKDSGIMAYNIFGSVCSGFPLSASDVDFWQDIMVGDFDSDGKVDLAGMGYTYVDVFLENPIICMWDLGTAYDESRMDWPMRSHDPQSTRFHDSNIDITPPEIIIVSPIDGGTCSSDLTVSGTVSDDVSEITFVSIAVDNSDPVEVEVNINNGEFSHQLTGLTEGSHKIIVTAQDEVGNVGTVSVYVNILYPPSAPTNLTTIAVSSAQIDLSWHDESDNEDGFKIERSLNGVDFEKIATLGIDATTYSNTELKSGTTYYYRVYAYNVAGSSEYSNRTEVTTLNVLRGVSITYPQTGQTISGEDLIVQAESSHPSDTYYMYLLIDGRYYAYDRTPPFEFIWNTNYYPNGSQHTLKVCAYFKSPDERIESEEIEVFVHNENPIIPALEVIDPTPVGETTVGGEVAVDVVGNDLDNYYYVYLLCDDNSYVGWDRNTPFQFSWNTIHFTNGPHTLKAKGYHKYLKNWVESAPIQVEVYNQDLNVPSVTITNLTEGQTVTGEIAIQASVNHPDRMRHVCFYIDEQYFAFDWQSPFEASLPTQYFTNDQHTIKVKGYHRITRQWYEDEVTVNVANDTPPIVPQIYIDSYTDGQTISGTQTITISSNDPANIRWMYLYVDGTYAGYDWSAPYAIDCDTTKYSNGTHTFKVRCYHTILRQWIESNEISLNIQN